MGTRSIVVVNISINIQRKSISRVHCSENFSLRNWVPPCVMILLRAVQNRANHECPQTINKNLGLIIPFKGIPPQKPRDRHWNNLLMVHRTSSKCHTADRPLTHRLLRDTVHRLYKALVELFFVENNMLLNHLKEKKWGWGSRW